MTALINACRSITGVEHAARTNREKLTAFLKKESMTWPQYFDGGGWQTKLAQDYGINSIPATSLIDGQGLIIAKDLRGDALAETVAKALKK